MIPSGISITQLFGISFLHLFAELISYAVKAKERHNSVTETQLNVRESKPLNLSA